MTKERKIEILKDLLIQLSDSANILCACEADERCEVIEEYIKALEQPTSDDCVSRRAVLDGIKSMSNANPSYWNHCDVVDRENLIDDIQSLPPVTPTQCIATVRFSKDDLREICNERIEIECTHGTCKDCKRGQKCEHGVYCTNLGGTNEECWYCADYEKRGSENV